MLRLAKLRLNTELDLSFQELVPCAAAGGLFPVGGGGGRGVIRLIFAEPNYRPYLSHFGANM